MTKTDVSTGTETSTGMQLGKALLLSIAGLFLLGVAAGVVAALIAKGALPPTPKLWVLILPVLCLPLALWCLRRGWQMAAPAADASNYERRYRKMWLWVMLLGMPIGMGLSLPIVREGKPNLNPLTNAPIPPELAILIVIAGVAMLSAAILIYHRTIDEQEERGYLWGSQIAYYFLSLALPTWWILQRGGLVPALTVGLAIALLLFSFVIQAAIWAWFKFR